MKKYDFLLDEIPISVMPEVVTERRAVADTLCDGGYAVILSPSDCADFGVLCIDKNNLELRELYLPFAALSCFFGKVLCYPKMTLEVKYRGKMYELPLSDNRPKFSVNVGKSKIKCAKTVKFADGIEVIARAVDCENAVITVLCHDSDLFDEGRLRLLLPSFVGEGARSSIAVSYTDKMRIKTVGKPLVYEAITAGLVTLSIEGIRLPDGECASLVDGKEFVFFKEKGNLTFYPEIDCIG